MQKLEGDLIKLALEKKFDLIVHGCNCFCTMGAGIARQIKANFPEAYQADLQTTKGNKNKLGTISWAKSQNPANLNLIIVNAYTQFDFTLDKINVDYQAIKSAFATIKQKFSGKKIAYPAIGAGLAGGDWQKIAAIIAKELEGEEHFFVEFK